MSSFSESNFAKKLADLNNSQQSIQTLSLWLIHHRKHSKTIVQVWHNELREAKSSRRLTFMYLANDVIQNSKKKGPEFSRDFKDVLPSAFKNTAKDADDKTKGSLERLVNIWKERGVFDKEVIYAIKDKLKGKDKKDVKRESKEKTPDLSSQPSTDGGGSGEPAKKKKKLPEPQFTLREEIEKEMAATTDQKREPPDAQDLVRVLTELEQSASSDAAVREKIAALPPEVSDASQLNKILDKDAATELQTMVDDACSLLTEYNSRLSAELEERKQVARLLRDFILAQKDELQQAQEKLDEYKTKLAKVTSVRSELKSHIQSLPDLTLLPDVTGGLAPLPSVGDLFSG